MYGNYGVAAWPAAGGYAQPAAINYAPQQVAVAAAPAKAQRRHEVRCGIFATQPIASSNNAAAYSQPASYAPTGFAGR